MTETKALLDLVQKQLNDFCAARKTAFEAISPELHHLVDYTESLLTGGKRFRALFCYWAWVGALDGKQTDLQISRSATGIAGIAAALEMFHAAALVHDDLLDQSDTRRGAPAAHVAFANIHRKSDWVGSPERFGTAGSVLTGDLMLGWSSEIFGGAMAYAATPEIEKSCREAFSLMRDEVMAGQYLDILEENSASRKPASEAFGRANKVMLYKTAKYSIESPLHIGATFAGASASFLQGLSNFGIPLGLAFQMRDDVLGVFGDSALTGKPTGDDLREGKRTALIALTRETLSSTVVKIFDELLESGELSEDQIKFLQQTIIGSGALEKIERMIVDLGDQSLAALESLELEPTAKAALRQLALNVINREA